MTKKQKSALDAKNGDTVWIVCDGVQNDRTVVLYPSIAKAIISDISKSSPVDDISMFVYFPDQKASKTYIPRKYVIEKGSKCFDCAFGEGTYLDGDYDDVYTGEEPYQVLYSCLFDKKVAVKLLMDRVSKFKSSIKASISYHKSQIKYFRREQYNLNVLLANECRKTKTANRDSQQV